MTPTNIINIDAIRRAINMIIVVRGIAPLKTSIILTELDVMAMANGININGYTIVNRVNPKNGKYGVGTYAGRRGGLRIQV
jgi:hypothetical protein